MTDDDIAAVCAVGLTEDQVFELIASDAVGAAPHSGRSATAS